MAGILAWFWNERFWLPHNVTWADLKNTDEATFPQAEDLYLACPLAFCIFMIRLVFERWVRSVTLPLFARRVMGRGAIFSSSTTTNQTMASYLASPQISTAAARPAVCRACSSARRLSASSRRVLPARSRVTVRTQHRANNRGVFLSSFLSAQLF